MTGSDKRKAQGSSTVAVAMAGQGVQGTRLKPEIKTIEAPKLKDESSKKKRG
jgi:hypothetical protein